MTFDYIAAWHKAAQPAYESLPQNFRDLLAKTATVAADLGQLRDCSMPWPDEDAHPEAAGFRESFRKAPAEYLALAARAIYSVGHWYPGKSVEGYAIPGRESGATWKFAHYADQELRERLGLPARGAGNDRGWGYEVHEGAIRITYASKDMWMWEEVAPATAQGLELARATVAKIEPTLATTSRERDNDVYEAFEALRANPPAWPDAWQPFQSNRYMVDDDVMAERRAEEDAKAAGHPNARAKVRAEILKHTAQKIADLERERDGMLWLLDHGLSVENCIYYAHTNIFTFGWRAPVSAPIVSAILDVISEFPYAYAIKCADGQKLEGGIG